MKKSFIILALTMFSFANAQKGTVLVAGSVGVYSSKSIYSTSESTYNDIRVSPKLGYQYNNNWTTGIEFSIGTNKQTNISTELQLNTTRKDKQNGFSVGGFLRYTKPLSEIFSIYADFGMGFQNTKRTENYFDGSTTFTTYSKGNGFYVDLTPAVFININKNFGLNFNIGGIEYNAVNYNNTQGDTRNLFLNFGQSVSIGVSKNF
ncbi:MAG: outer membrane beta-barrel protein [Bacteroidota bacterium]